jgi:Ricin-type beta-trefoil lectin domain
MATLSDGTSDGTSVVLYSCTGDTNQQWRYRSDGSLVNVRSGTCLDDTNGVTTNGQQLQIWTCDAGSHQSWTLP